jgi:hypothetical protein
VAHVRPPPVVPGGPREHRPAERRVRSACRSSGADSGDVEGAQGTRSEAATAIPGPVEWTGATTMPRPAPGRLAERAIHPGSTRNPDELRGASPRSRPGETAPAMAGPSGPVGRSVRRRPGRHRDTPCGQENADDRPADRRVLCDSPGTTRRCRHVPGARVDRSPRRCGRPAPRGRLRDGRPRPRPPPFAIGWAARSRMRSGGRRSRRC